MSFGAPSPPSPPDPKETIAAQSAADKEAVLTQADVNRVNQVTPFGTLTYDQTGTSESGNPTYTATTTLSPEQQALLNQQTGITGQLYGLSSNQLNMLEPVLASGLNTSGLVNSPGQVDVNSLPNMVGGSTDADIGAAAKRAEDLSFNSFMNRFEPQIERSRQRTEQRLADRGIDYGQDQYREMTDANEQNIYDAIQNASSQAQQIGNTQALQQSQFSNAARTDMLNQILAANQANQAQRQAGLQEQAYLRNIPINDIAALLGTSSGVQMPQFQSVPNVQVPRTDVAGITNSAYQNQLGAYGVQASQPTFMDQLFGLGGTLGGAWILSDRHIKHIITKLHKWGRHQLYAFRYKWSPFIHVGVMAQEVEKYQPEAVIMVNGYKMVDYGALNA